MKHFDETFFCFDRTETTAYADSFDLVGALQEQANHPNCKLHLCPFEENEKNFQMDKVPYFFRGPNRVLHVELWPDQPA